MERKRQRSKKTIFLPVLLLIIIVSAILLIRSSIFIVYKVEVQLEKIRCADEKEIRDQSNLLGQNFFFLNSSNVENNLKKRFLCIKNVILNRNFPNKIKLSVLGRESAALLIKSRESTHSAILKTFIESSSSANFTFPFELGENFVVDNEGVIFSQEQVDAPKIQVSGFSLSLGQKVHDDLLNVLKILEKLKTFGINAREVMILEGNLLINATPKIIFKLNKEISSQIASLQLILEKSKIDSSELEFIDLRFDKPIVRLAPKKK